MRCLKITFAFLGICVSVSNAYPQGLLFLNDLTESSTSDPTKPSRTPIPYSPLPPMHLPPFFQNLGITLPPPPPQPLFFGTKPAQYQLQNDKEGTFASIFSNAETEISPWANNPDTTEQPKPNQHEQNPVLQVLSELIMI